MIEPCVFLAGNEAIGADPIAAARSSIRMLKAGNENGSEAEGEESDLGQRHCHLRFVWSRRSGRNKRSLCRKTDEGNEMPSWYRFNAGRLGKCTDR